MKTVALLFAVLHITACSTSGEKEETTQPQAAIDTIAIAEEAATETTVIVTDSISILLAASYNSEEFNSELESMAWVGLFMNDNAGVSCYKTELKIEQVHDPMADEEGEKTGKKISCKGYDNNPMLMVAGIENLEGRRIDAYKGLKSQLLPGETMKLGDYTIKASGSMQEGDVNTLRGYKLQITGEKNGKHIEQTFIEQDFFDDGMIHFIWAGDIDGDGYPDLYMDISYKYSFSNPALFLSSKSGKNELLKLVAEYRRYGC